MKNVLDIPKRVLTFDECEGRVCGVVSELEVFLNHFYALPLNENRVRVFGVIIILLPSIITSLVKTRLYIITTYFLTFFKQATSCFY